MVEVLLSVVTGIVVGGVFALVGATVPAPPNLAGVMGVVGITLGYLVVIGLRGS